MSGYSRKISYIYEYKDGLKGENKGFIKTEIRDNKGKMDIELRGLERMEEPAVTIGYYLWEDDKIKVCDYDKRAVNERDVKLELEFDVNDIKGAGLGEIGGVIIWNNKKMYSAEWTEEGFESSKIVWVDTLKTEEKALDETEDKIIITEDLKKTATSNDNLGELQEGMLAVQEIPDFLKVKKKEKKSRVKYEKSYHMKISNWKDFFKKYDIVEPFSDDIIYDCVEIKYDDLKYLPISCKNVQNNSFLLHGLYCYEHVLVGKLKCKRRKAMFILGVPGRYDNNQRIVASMFGFDNFKMGTRGNVRDKNFGYWYTLFADDEQ